MIKVFLSHQKADSDIAGGIAYRLRIYHGIESYLDVIDPHINRKGEDLASHIQEEMSKCTQLLAVVSRSTRESQWVPWEIGVATEKNYPLATFSQGEVPPEFLRKWPYLRNESELDAYAKASKAAEAGYNRRKAVLNEGIARSLSTRQFFVDLRAAINQ